MSKKKKKHVELEKLRLGMDNQGRVHVGEINKEGKLKSNKMKDVSGDFQRLMQIQISVAVTTIQNRTKKVQEKPKIEVVTDLKSVPKPKGDTK